MFIIHVYKDADVAQTSVGVTYSSFMKCVKENMCFMCSPQTNLRMATTTPTFALHCLIKARRLRWRHTTLAITKQWNTWSLICLVCTNMFLVHVYKTLLNFDVQDMCFSHLILLQTLEPYLRLHGTNAIYKMCLWLMFCYQNLVLPRGFWLRLHTNTKRESKHNTFMSIFCIIRFILNTGY